MCMSCYPDYYQDLITFHKQRIIKQTLKQVKADVYFMMHTGQSDFNLSLPVHLHKILHIFIAKLSGMNH